MTYQAKRNCCHHDLRFISHPGSLDLILLSIIDVGVVRSSYDTLKKNANNVNLVGPKGNRQPNSTADPLTFCAETVSSFVGFPLRKCIHDSSFTAMIFLYVLSHVINNLLLFVRLSPDRVLKVRSGCSGAEKQRVPGVKDRETVDPNTLARRRSHSQQRDARKMCFQYAEFCVVLTFQLCVSVHKRS